jgi:hypothetical protein
LGGKRKRKNSGFGGVKRGEICEVGGKHKGRMRGKVQKKTRNINFVK